jgi:fructosamine-3-kinase
MWSEIINQISQVSGEQWEMTDRRSVGGGCINQAYIINLRATSNPAQRQQQQYFVKLNRASLLDMFTAEAWGLREMQQARAITVPTPICWGTANDSSFLVLSYLNLGATGTQQNWVEMGRQLASMHRYELSPDLQFGWHINNTIGSTPQINTWEADWTTFWQKHRLGYQLKLAQRRGGNIPQKDAILSAIPTLLAHHHPQPSLVHGDLWGGNASFTRDGIPVIFDPATYWGDREVDIAMTELFGGFPAAFYQGYNAVFPLDPGYKRRKLLYNLYHILNHYNLFGGGYLGQANQSIERLLANL